MIILNKVQRYLVLLFERKKGCEIYSYYVFLVEKLGVEREKTKKLKKNFEKVCGYKK